MEENSEMSPTNSRRAANDAAGIMRALSNPARLMILCKLFQSDRTVGQLERELDLGQAYVSQQLAQLREKQLVVATRDGRQMRYRLRDQRLKPILGVILDEFCPNAH